MAKKTEKMYKCGNCPEGKVTLVKKETKQTIELTVKKCTKCKAEYGLIGLGKLEECEPLERLVLSGSN
jgi:ssDNA-binding Zn-finger/Zn-ribbon topoisomerase 1